MRSDPLVYRPLSWLALCIELCAPILLWFAETRRAALAAVVALHLGIEYAMNLLLFEWVMPIGWISHAQPEDLSWLRSRAAAPMRVASQIGKQRHLRPGSVTSEQ